MMVALRILETLSEVTIAGGELFKESEKQYR